MGAVAGGIPRGRKPTFARRSRSVRRGKWSSLLFRPPRSRTPSDRCGPAGLADAARATDCRTSRASRARIDSWTCCAGRAWCAIARPILPAITHPCREPRTRCCPTPWRACALSRCGRGRLRDALEQRCAGLFDFDTGRFAAPPEVRTACGLNCSERISQLASEVDSRASRTGTGDAWRNRSMSTRNRPAARPCHGSPQDFGGGGPGARRPSIEIFFDAGAESRGKRCLRVQTWTSLVRRRYEGIDRTECGRQAAEHRVVPWKGAYMSLLRLRGRKTSLVKAHGARNRACASPFSYTTRQRSRPNEIEEGITIRDAGGALRKWSRGQRVLEHARVSDKLLWNRLEAGQGGLEQGELLLLEIDWQGARQSAPGCRRHAASLHSTPLRRRARERLRQRHTGLRSRDPAAPWQTRAGSDAIGRIRLLVINDRLSKRFWTFRAIVEERGSRLTAAKPRFHAFATGLIELGIAFPSHYKVARSRLSAMILPLQMDLRWPHHVADCLQNEPSIQPRVASRKARPAPG